MPDTVTGHCPSVLLLSSTSPPCTSRRAQQPISCSCSSMLLPCWCRNRKAPTHWVLQPLLCNRLATQEFIGNGSQIDCCCFLQTARKQGDFLLVGLHGDEDMISPAVKSHQSS
jgi:hypothetical protein